MCCALQKKKKKLKHVSSPRELKFQMKNMKWHLRKKTEHALHTLKCVSKLWIYSLAATHSLFLCVSLPHTHKYYQHVYVLSADVNNQLHSLFRDVFFLP